MCSTGSVVILVIEAAIVIVGVEVTGGAAAE